jgi:hypothetical protein
MGREAIIVYGDWSHSWDALCKACQFTVTQTTYYGPGWRKVPARVVAESVVRRGQFRQDFALLQRLADLRMLGTPQLHQLIKKAEKCFDQMSFLKRSRLKALLPELRPTQATYAVDKVLALTGFAHDDGLKVVFPNGNDQIELLYLTVVKYWITTQEDTPYLSSLGLRHGRKEPLMWDEWPSPLVVKEPELSFLNHLGEAKHTTLPSWVPDWSAPLEATPLLSLEGFRAATGWLEPASIVSVGNEHRLLVKRIRVGTVSAVAPDMADFESHAKMLDAFADPYPTTGMTYLDAYKAIASPVGPGLAAEPERSPACAGFWASTKAEDVRVPNPRPLRYTAQDLQDVLDPLHQIGACQQPDQPHLTGRVLFSSREGLLGLGPKRTAVGDVVCVIAGAAVPFVLRAKQDGTYTVLGECYTFGVMHGEVVKALPEGKIEDLILV